MFEDPTIQGEGKVGRGFLLKERKGRQMSECWVKEERQRVIPTAWGRW